LDFHDCRRVAAQDEIDVKGEPTRAPVRPDFREATAMNGRDIADDDPLRCRESIPEGWRRAIAFSHHWASTHGNGRHGDDPGCRDPTEASIGADSPFQSPRG
jgi:hypothetical protein